MAPLRIGSLFTGTGALDLAVMDTFDAEVVWHSQYEPPDKNGKEDKNQYAAKILARHWPETPNLGDITKVDWQDVMARYGQVDIVTGGFPCTDVSSAGQRAGLTPETRSGLWNHMARCIAVLRPRLVVIENVEGLLSAEADRGLESGAEAVDEGAGAGGVLRALGAVLGDLATLGFHAEWERVGADEVGAPHRRRRVIIYAWPADADPADLGHQWRGSTWGWRNGPSDGGVVAADAVGVLSGNDGELPSGRDSVQRGVRNDAARCGQDADADSDLFGRRSSVLDLRAGEPDVEWGDYEPVIRRWERLLGRSAPWPSDALGRLSAVFTEWMMGLPDGWVTCTPGLTRNAMLKALGNGVVPQQAMAAIRLLHQRAINGGIAANAA
jgi:DNA (cytosine-5)-methyltransferase 1